MLVELMSNNKVTELIWKFGKTPSCGSGFVTPNGFAGTLTSARVPRDQREYISGADIFRREACGT